ncbi:hypothetical protein, partial [Pseudonocardia sp. 73-21]
SWPSRPGSRRRARRSPPLASPPWWCRWSAICGCCAARI